MQCCSSFGEGMSEAALSFQRGRIMTEASLRGSSVAHLVGVCLRRRCPGGVMKGTALSLQNKLIAARGCLDQVSM